MDPASTGYNSIFFIVPEWAPVGRAKPKARKGILSFTNILWVRVATDETLTRCFTDFLSIGHF